MKGNRSVTTTDHSTDLLEEFQIYVNYQNDLLNLFNIPAFWNAN